jgi:guanylate kinase
MIIVTAPSGAGKTTIVKHLLNVFDNLAFSVSATTRSKRANEVEGKDYYFLSLSEFKSLIDKNSFIEWQEVYENQYYGTLLSEVERLWAFGKHIIFDIDVKGALNLKKAFPESTLSIFIKPPSREALFERLRSRKSETEESLKKRIDKATLELPFEKEFDVVIENKELSKALEKAVSIVSKWLNIDLSVKKEHT